MREDRPVGPATVGPFSRPFPVGRVVPGGVDARVEATEEERAALAADLGLPALRRLVGEFRLTGLESRIRLAGRILAEIDQTCVVTLDAFPSTLREDVEVEFRVAETGRRPSTETLDLDPDEDGPEELTGDHIDLGAVAAEFLVLGLDPYPRKPGVAFASQDEPADPANSPFAGLAALAPKDAV